MVGIQDTVALLHGRVRELKNHQKDLTSRINDLQNEKTTVVQRVTLTVGQLRDALNFASCGDDPDEEFTIAVLTAETAPVDDDGKRDVPGIYISCADYPEEGWYGPLSTPKEVAV